MGSILKQKSFRFAVEIADLCRFLKESKAEHSLQRQLFRSGTSVGALISEAEFAQSKADFINKLSIALKEANETRYWLELLEQSQYVSIESVAETKALLAEIIKMLIASIKTAKQRS